MPDRRQLASVRRELDRLAEARLQHDLSPQQQHEYEELIEAESALLIIDRLTAADSRAAP